MKAFHGGQEAKEFLISNIVAEAQRENIPLSEVERKMLYFTESGWTFPTSCKLTRTSTVSTTKASTSRKSQSLSRKPTSVFARVHETITTDGGLQFVFFEREDHYISVMVRLAGLRPRGDQLRLFVTGLAIVSVILMWIFVAIKYNIPMPSRGEFGVLVWAVLACLFVAYTFLRFILGRKRTDDLTSTVLEKFARIWWRVSGNA